MGRFLQQNPEELGAIFRADETVTSGYIRYDQHITKRLNAMAGIRFENTNLDYKGKKLTIPAKGEGGDPVLEDLPQENDTYLNVLPSVLLKYDATRFFSITPVIYEYHRPP